MMTFRSENSLEKSPSLLSQRERKDSLHLVEEKRITIPFSFLFVGGFLLFFFPSLHYVKILMKKILCCRISSQFSHYLSFSRELHAGVFTHSVICCAPGIAFVNFRIICGEWSLELFCQRRALFGNFYMVSEKKKPKSKKTVR